MELTLDDTLELSEEQLAELSSKNYYRFFEHDLLRNVLFDNLPLDKVVMFYKCDKEYFNSFRKAWISSDKFESEYKHFFDNCNESNFKEAVMNFYDYYLTNDSHTIEPSNFLDDFVNRHKDIFLIDAPIPDDIKNKFYKRNLSATDFVDYIEYFDGNFFVENSLELGFVRSFYFSGHTNRDEVVKFFAENKEFIKFLMKEYIIFGENDKFTIETLLFKAQKKIIEKFDNFDDFKVMVESGQLPWINSMYTNVLTSIESLDELFSVTDKTFICDTEQFEFIYRFGIHNLNKFENEYHLFEKTGIATFRRMMRIYTSNKEYFQFESGSYEDFLDNMCVLLAYSRKSKSDKIEFDFLKDTLGLIKPQLFRPSNIPKSFNFEYPYDFGEIDIKYLLNNLELLPYLKDRDLSLDLNVKISLYMNDRYYNFIKYFTDKFGNEAFFDLVIKYRKFLDDITIYVRDDDKFDTLEDIEYKIYQAIVNKYLNRYSFNNSFKEISMIPSICKQYPDLFFDFSTLENQIDKEEIERLDNEYYSFNFSLANFKKYPFLVDLFKDKDIRFYSCDDNNANYVIQTVGKDEFYKLCVEYGDLFEYALKKLYISRDDEKRNIFNNNPREYIENIIANHLLTGTMKYDSRVPEHFKEKHSELFLSEDVPEEIQNKFYNRELTIEDFVNNQSLLALFGNTNVVYGFPLIVAKLCKVTAPSGDVVENNYYRLKVVEDYQKLNDFDLGLSYLDYFEEYGENFDLSKLEYLTNVLLRLRLSNSGEIRHIKVELASQLLRTDDPISSLDKIEDIFIKNNLPYVGKIYSCFQVLHPNFDGFDIEKSLSISPVLKGTTPRLRNAIVFADLIKTSMSSNNRSMSRYLDNLEIGSRIVADISNGVRGFDELSKEELDELGVFVNHLYTLYNNTVRGKREEGIFRLSGNLKNDITTLISKFSPDGESLEYNLGDRIVRMFCGFAGINTVKEAKDYLTTTATLATERHKDFDPKMFKLEPGDFIKGINDFKYLGNILQNGSVAKEYLGSSAGSDMTPLDTDLSMITVEEDDIRKQFNETEAREYGNIHIVLKRDDRFYITRTLDGPVEGVKRDMSKLEAFYTGVDGPTHYGIRTGFGSTDIDCFIVENWDDRIGLEIAMNGFYIPVIDRDKNLVFTYENYKDLRSKMSGLSYYGEDTYSFAPDLDGDGIDETISDIEASREETEFIKSEINRRIGEALKNSGIVKVYNGFSGDLSTKSAEIYDTGSTARGTNVPGDSDFDYLIKVDKAYFEEEGALDNFKAFMNSQLGLSDGPGGKIVGVININGFDADVEISFMNKTNSIEFSTDAALSQRLDNIRKQDPEKYRYVLANIVLAKKVMKEFNVYKSAKSNASHGGLGGIGIENWILQNGGSFKSAAESFLKAADGKSFEEFVKCYFVYDFGSNHYAANEDSSTYTYPHENFVYQGDRKMTFEGYIKMRDALKSYLKLYDIEEEVKKGV